MTPTPTPAEHRPRRPDRSPGFAAGGGWVLVGAAGAASALALVMRLVVGA